MGQVGRWIDNLEDEQRDRLVTAQHWGYTWAGGPVKPLTGVEDYWLSRPCMVEHARGCRGAWMVEKQVAYRYDELCSRFGLARVERAVKVRAGAKVPDSPYHRLARAAGLWTW